VRELDLLDLEYQHVDVFSRLWVGGPVAPVASGRFHARLT
jgi:hypothetical protein